MKSTRKKTKVPLHFTATDNAVILGIVANEPDYKLSLLINKEIRISLKSHPPIEFTDDKGQNLTFSKFSDSSGSPDLLYSLISNKSDNSYLIKKLKSYDYLFLIQDSNDDFNPALITQKLKESGIFRAVFLIDQNDVNDKYLHYLIP